MLVKQTQVEKNAQGSDKIARYGWKLRDGCGELKFIPKSALNFDRAAYQREEQSAKVLRMASNWSWIACGALRVARRSNGEFYVIDGEQRTLAARRRSDIAVLPCVVFDVESVKDEASGFLQSNTERKPITALDKFKARLTTETETAILVKELIDASGREARNRDSGVRCVSVLEKHAGSNPERLRAIWPIIDAICMNHPIHNRIVEALMYVELHMPNGDSLAKSHWRHRLLNIGYDEILHSINKAAAFYASGGAKVWGEGLRQRLNYRAKNPLELA